MKELTAIEILENAKSLIKCGWTQGAFARGKDGRTLKSYRSRSATHYCALAALMKPDKTGTWSRQTLGFLQDALPPSSSTVMSYNDAPATTQADIVHLFDRAIELAKASGKAC